jgi:hypothetical protein
VGLLTWVRTQWDRAAALVVLAIGLLALLLGWIGVSGNANVGKALPYVVSGGLLGIFLMGVAATLWLSADLRDEWRELHGIRLALREQLDRSALPVTGRTASGADPAVAPLPADLLPTSH